MASVRLLYYSAAKYNITVCSFYTRLLVSIPVGEIQESGTTQHLCLVNPVQLLEFLCHLVTATLQSGTTVVTIASNHPPDKIIVLLLIHH